MPRVLGAGDVFRHFSGSARLTAGRRVTVGIIDTGIGVHPDLAVDGGENTVPLAGRDDCVSPGNDRKSLE